MDCGKGEGKGGGVLVGGLSMAFAGRLESPEGFVMDLRLDLLPRGRGRVPWGGQFWGVSLVTLLSHS